MDRAGCPALDPSTWQRAQCLRHYLDVEQCVSPLWDTRPQVPLVCLPQPSSHITPKPLGPTSRATNAQLTPTSGVLHTSYAEEQVGLLREGCQ